LGNEIINIGILYGSVNGAIWLLFNASEHVLKAPDIKKIAQWLKGIIEIGTTQKASWPEGIISTFDSLFIPKKRRENPSPTKSEWRRNRPGFFRSVLASILSVTLLYLIITILFVPNWVRSAEGTVFWQVMVFMTVFLNLLPDYFSIWETRLILSKIQKSPNMVFQILWLFLDCLITFLVPLLALFTLFTEYPRLSMHCKEFLYVKSLGVELIPFILISLLSVPISLLKNEHHIGVVNTLNKRQ